MTTLPPFLAGILVGALLLGTIEFLWVVTLFKPTRAAESEPCSRDGEGR